MNWHPNLGIKMNKREARLRWALRYIMSHPDFGPSILSEEWKLEQDLAIEVCSHTFAECIVSRGCLHEGKFEDLEDKIFNKLKKL